MTFNGFSDLTKERKNEGEAETEQVSYRQTAICFRVVLTEIPTAGSNTKKRDIYRNDTRRIKLVTENGLCFVILNFLPSAHLRGTDLMGNHM